MRRPARSGGPLAFLGFGKACIAGTYQTSEHMGIVNIDLGCGAVGSAVPNWCAAIWHGDDEKSVTDMPPKTRTQAGAQAMSLFGNFKFVEIFMSYAVQLLVTHPICWWRRAEK